MSEPSRGRGSLTIDLQGPFALKADLIGEGGRPFVAVALWPDVSIYITTGQEADRFIAVMREAKALLRPVKP